MLTVGWRTAARSGPRRRHPKFNPEHRPERKPDHQPNFVANRLCYRQHHHLGDPLPGGPLHRGKHIGADRLRGHRP